MQSNIVVNPQEFYHRQHHPEDVVVEISTQQSFLHGHLQNARLVPWQATLNQNTSMPGFAPDIATLTRVLERLGHGPDRVYWIYDDEGGGWAGRFIWLLHLIGHEQVYYINGGKHAWVAENLPLVQEKQPYSSTTVSDITINPQKLVLASQIIDDLHQFHAWQYWDARSSDEFNGYLATAQRNGHIPGAIHCEWTRLMDPVKGLMIRDNSADILQELGFSFDKKCITYCQSNHRSGFTYLVGRHLGMDIHPYPGAWNEWGNRTDTPIETLNPK